MSRDVIRDVIARALLFCSLCGFGSMMGPRQTEFTRSRDAHLFWTLLFAAMAVAAVSLLIEGVKKATRTDAQ